MTPQPPLITLDEFIAKYDKTFVEVAGSPGAVNQCVDLANAYLRDVLGHPIVEHTNARDFPSKLKDFTWVENTPEAVPGPGDIMIWQHNQYGHISIYIDGDINEFHSFDQNYPLKSPAHIQKHNYLKPKVAGWLRPVQSTTGTMPENENVQKLLTKYGVKDLPELDKKIEEHVGTDWGATKDSGFLGGEREKTKDLKATSEAQAATIRSLSETHKLFVEWLLERLAPDPTQYEGVPHEDIIKSEINKIIDREAEKDKTIKQLEKSKALVESEKNEEIKTLKTEIERLQGQLDNMKQRIENLENPSTAEKELANLLAERTREVTSRIGRFLRGLFTARKG